jgi:hypothetical protein
MSCVGECEHEMQMESRDAQFQLAFEELKEEVMTYIWVDCRCTEVWWSFQVNKLLAKGMSVHNTHNFLHTVSLFYPAVIRFSTHLHANL